MADFQKVIVITGCDSGFGQLLLKETVAAGYVVVAAHLAEAAARTTRENFSGATNQVIAVATDLTVSVEPVVQAALQAVSSDPGRCLWAIINNAGIAIPGITELLPPAVYEKTFAVNFFAPVALTYSLLPTLKKTLGSRVINVTSVDGFIPLPNNAAYNASKHALEAYSDTLRVEMRPWDVKVVVVEPATMRTPLALSFYKEWLRTFKAAPEDRRRDYGDKWAERTEKVGTKIIEQTAADPMDTVVDLMDALAAADPKVRYLSGQMAKDMWFPMSQLPIEERDKQLEALAYPTLPIALEKRKQSRL